MKNINILYFDNYDDVDIVCVPNIVCEDLDNVVQKYFNWLSSTKDHGHWKIKADGTMYIECDDAEVFVEWINQNFKEDENEAYIVKRNTKYDPHYVIAEF